MAGETGQPGITRTDEPKHWEIQITRKSPKRQVILCVRRSAALVYDVENRLPQVKQENTTPVGPSPQSENRSHLHSLSNSKNVVAEDIWNKGFSRLLGTDDESGSRFDDVPALTYDRRLAVAAYQPSIGTARLCNKSNSAGAPCAPWGAGC